MKLDWKLIVTVALGVVVAFVGVKLLSGYLPADAKKYVPTALTN